jgi:glutamyl-tRNA reductase
MNHLVVCGLNYHNTPIAIRERFSIPQSCLAHASAALSHLPHIKEAALVSTCNRTEVYATVDNVQAACQEIGAFFASTQGIVDHEVLQPNFRLLREDVALHLFRLAAGLDSMILGENQIMSQLKTAHQIALASGTAGPVLDYLFKSALNCGKRVRTETNMGKRAVSVSSAAVELGRNLLKSLAGRTSVIVGAGRMGQICAKILLNEPGSGSVILLNRTKERLLNFSKNKLPNATKLKIDFDFEERLNLAAAADLIVVSTGAPSFIINKDEFAKARQGYENHQICIVDISVPRNVDPEIADLPGVKLFHSDDLAELVQLNLAEREALIGDAEKIVFETLDEFHAWQRSLLVVPTIAGLREKIEAIRLEQMAKGKNKCALAGDDNQDKQQVEEISRAIINQILHHPTTQLKATRDYEILRQQAEALRTLFNLDPLSDGPNNSKKKNTGNTIISTLTRN